MDQKFVIVEGKTLPETIQNGLKILNKSIDEVEVEVLQEGNKIMGFQTSKYKVKLLVKKTKPNTMTGKENVFKNGRCEIKSLKEGKFLYIYPPKGTGKPINIDEIFNLLNDNGIHSFDVEKIKTLLNNDKTSYIEIEKLQQDSKIDEQINIEISNDEIAAYMTIFPPKEGRMITKEEVYDILESKNIIKGIDYDLITEMIESKQFLKKQRIASGSQPINGMDGKIEHFFNTEIKIKPTLLEDGSVNMKELNIIQTVSEGECLAQKNLPTEGIDGFTVTGKILKSKNGKPVYFKKGKNVIETEDGLRLIAGTTGQPRLIDGKITVLEIYEVNGNVDNSTGNIRFVGKVIIKGNVRTGFTVECSDDVEVYGVVEGATIISNGNIVLHKGIQGQNVGKLISKQNIIARYMESCYAKAHGNISAEAIMHCIIESKDTVNVTGKKGLIVGGQIRVNHEVNAKFIGSPMATVTNIEVGIDPETKEKYENLKIEEAKLKKNKNRVSQIVDLLKKMSKTAALTKEKQNLLQKSVRTENLLTKRLQEINEELKYLNSILVALSNGQVNVSDTIYPGVQIHIGNSVYYVRDEIQYSTLFRKDSEIQIVPYKGKE